MNPTIIGIIVFTCTFGGTLLGMGLRRILPGHHLSNDSKDTVKVGIGLIATMTALVLGIVTASAKSSYDAVDSAVKKSATDILNLDRYLARYGSETGDIRKGLKRAIGARIDMIWPQGASKRADLNPMGYGESEGLTDAISALKPRDDSQRGLQSRALDLAEQLLKERWLVLAGTGTSIAVPFLVVLLFWLTITFVSFGLFAPGNTTVLLVLFVCALSVAGAVFLILEMDAPFEGLVQVSGDPLRYAYAHLNQ
jgi:hypothetical protein